MFRASSSMLAAAALLALLPGCRFACDGPLGCYDWSLLCHRPAACCAPVDGLPARCRRRCPPPPPTQDPGATDALAVDAAASSELMPLPVRPVFGARMDGRQVGDFSQPIMAEPPAEEIRTPAPAPAGDSSSLKLRAIN